MGFRLGGSRRRKIRAWASGDPKRIAKNTINRNATRIVLNEVRKLAR